MKWLIPAFLLATISAGPATAESKPAPLDPRYTAAVTRMEQTLKSLPSYTVNVKLDWKAGDGAAGSNLFSLQFERPNKFRIETRAHDSQEPTLIVVDDGTTAISYLPDKKFYTRDPLPNPARLLEVNPMLATSLKGSLIDSLLRPELKNYILSHTREAALVGNEKIDDQSVDHFHLTWGRDEEEFWLGPEGQTLPRKLVRIYNFPGKDEAALKLTTTTTLTWAVGKPIDPKLFKLDLPKEAKLVDDLEEALTSGATELLIGKPLPEITLPKLGGGTMKLDDAKGKKSSVLVFWASWNAVSVQALPAIAKLPADFKDVEFLAINAGEDAPAVAAYVKKQPLGLDVLLDSDDKAIEHFGVTNLPTLIVVDKGGIIRAIHEGASNDLAKAARAGLEALATDGAKKP